MRSALVLACSLVVLGASSSVRADRPLRLFDGRLAGPAQGRGDRVTAYASVATGTGRTTSLASATTSAADTLVVVPDFGFRLAMSESFDVSMDWLVGYGTVHVLGGFDDGTSLLPFDQNLEVVAAGNPTLGGSFHAEWTILALELGLRAAFPVAALSQAPSDVPTAVSRAASRAMHETMLGAFSALDPWRFLPERASLVVPMRVVVGDVIGGTAEITPGITFPVLGGQGGVEGLIQVSGELAVAPIHELRAGLRGSFVVWRLGSDATRSQAALEPFVRIELKPGFLVLRASVPLGSTFGADGPTPVWAAHIGGGFTFSRDELR
jgi:hypothetical protein